MDKEGKVTTAIEKKIRIAGHDKKVIPCVVELPQQEGGYLVVAEYYPEDKKEPVISRRYITVGKENTNYEYYEIKP